MVIATSSSEPPTSVGLACRQVGACRRQLVKQYQFIEAAQLRLGRSRPGVLADYQALQCSAPQAVVAVPQEVGDRTGTRCGPRFRILCVVRVAMGGVLMLPPGCIFGGSGSTASQLSTWSAGPATWPGGVAISSHPRRRNPDTRCSCLQLTEQVRWTTGQLVRVVVVVNPLHVCGQYRINQPVVVGGGVDP